MASRHLGFFTAVEKKDFACRLDAIGIEVIERISYRIGR
jgi:hypothetical protein